MERLFVGGPGDDSIELFEPNPEHKHMKLEPCPFCGSGRIFYERYESPAGERWRCWCSECLAGIDPGIAQEVGQVREMWNRRTAPPSAPLTLEELREMEGETVWVMNGHNGQCSCHVIDRAYAESIFFTDNLALATAFYGRAWTAYRRRSEGGAT